MKRDYKYFDFIVGIFVTVLLVSNLLSSAKIIDMGIELNGFAFIFDAGTLAFPISYIFGDILTEIYGYKRSRRVIWTGFFATAIMGFFVWLAGILPGESEWGNYAGQVAYDSILGGITGLVIASLIAYLVGEFTNSYVLARMKVATRGKYLWARTIGSTLLGQVVDTLAFFLIACALGVFSWNIFWSLVITNYIFKVSIEVLFTPITLRVINFLKKSEKEDVYDDQTDFNPFNV